MLTVEYSWRKVNLRLTEPGLFLSDFNRRAACGCVVAWHDGQQRQGFHLMMLFRAVCYLCVSPFTPVITLLHTSLADGVSG